MPAEEVPFPEFTIKLLSQREDTPVNLTQMCIFITDAT